MDSFDEPPEKPRRGGYTPEEYRQRPRDLDIDLASQIIERVSNGEPLTVICARDRDMPLPATFLRWMREDSQLEAEFTQALSVRNDILVEEIVELSSGSDPKQSRVEVDARRFVVERTSPEKYGLRSYQHQRSRDDDAPGVDYAADVRRRIEQMARRLREEESVGAPNK